MPAFYGMERHRGQRRVVFVEGIPDTVRLTWEYRDDADTLVVGLTSASFSDTRLPLDAFKGSEITILGDGDDAGRRATEKLADTLSKVASVSVVPLPEGYEDVCSYDGDLKNLVGSAVPRTPQHYLERPEVSRTLDKIVKGTAEIKLRAVLDELPPLPTDRLDQTLIRKTVADRLTQADFPVAIADAWVATHPREDKVFDQMAGAVQGRDVEPWPDPVDGAELLEEVRADIKRFVFISDGRTYDLLSAWVLHTYIFEEFPTTAYLHITAPSMMSGKTRLLEILEEYCRRALLAGGISPAVLYRVVEMHKPTLLIDEVDTIFGDRSETSQAIRQVLNNGYTRGKPIFRMELGPDDKQHAVSFDPYSPKALAGIGRIPDTIASRSIRIDMVRKKRGEEADRYARRERESLKARAAVWRSKAERWVQDRHGQFDIDPAFPQGLSDRTQDCLEPLFVVGEMAGAGWSERLRAAAVALNARIDPSDAEDLGAALLHDLNELREQGELGEGPHVSTEALLLRLNRMDDRPWPHLKLGRGLSGMQLAKLMKGFGIPPRRYERNTVRGYSLVEIEGALERWS